MLGGKGPEFRSQRPEVTLPLPLVLQEELHQQRARVVVPVMPEDPAVSDPPIRFARPALAQGPLEPPEVPGRLRRKEGREDPAKGLPAQRARRRRRDLRGALDRIASGPRERREGLRNFRKTMQVVVVVVVVGVEEGALGRGHRLQGLLGLSEGIPRGSRVGVVGILCLLQPPVCDIHRLLVLQGWAWG